MQVTDIQTRATNGDITSFKKIDDAYHACLKDQGIWKLSFTVIQDSKEIRKRYRRGYFKELTKWQQLSYQKMISLSGDFRIADRNPKQCSEWLFWIQQDVISSGVSSIKDAPEDVYYASLITEVLTDPEFRNKYC